MCFFHYDINRMCAAEKIDGKWHKFVHDILIKFAQANCFSK